MKFFHPGNWAGLFVRENFQSGCRDPGWIFAKILKKFTSILKKKKLAKKFNSVQYHFINKWAQILQKKTTFSPDKVLVSPCMSKLSQISHIRFVFNKGLLEIIINALVFSKLYYCSSVWSSTSSCNVRKLQYVQNFAARIICNVRKYDHISPVLRNLRRLP